MGKNARPQRQDVREAAASWAVRLSDPACTDDDRAAFEAWRGREPAHEAAFEREAAAWDRFDRLRAYRPADPHPDPDLLAPGRGEGALPLLRRMAAPRQFARIAAGAAGAAVLAGVVFWSLNAAPAYATAVGERRLVVLEDGTRVELNTDSRIVVRYRRGERSIRLVKGEALFDVASDTRPLVVTAGGRRVEAQDSAFNVRIQPQGVQVIVAEGDVEVAEVGPLGGSGDEEALSAGVIGLYASGGGVSQAAPRDRIEQALAWRHGQIALNGQTLEHAAAEFNRYSKDRQIVVADPAIAGYRLGGYFQVDDMDGFVRALQTTFPVKSTRSDGTIYLSARAAEAGENISGGG